jgi:hypothetical protein
MEIRDANKKYYIKNENIFYIPLKSEMRISRLDSNISI